MRAPESPIAATPGASMVGNVLQQIEQAASAEEVVRTVRDHVATWLPEEIARLPDGVRPGRIRDAVDVQDLHLRLIEEYRATRASGDELAALQRLTGLVMRACLRIARLDAQAPALTAGRKGAA